MAGEVKAELAGGDDRNVDDGFQLAEQRVDHGAHREGVVALARGRERVRGPLAGVHAEQEAEAEVVARIVRRVGLRLEPVQVDLRIGALHPVDMGAHARRVGRHVLQDREALVPDAQTALVAFGGKRPQGGHRGAAMSINAGVR